jgi:hypothetical protein
LGTAYTNAISGVYTNSISFQSYGVAGKFARMTGTVALNYDYRTHVDDKVHVWIYGDGILLYESPMITASCEPDSFDLPLAGIKDIQVSIYGIQLALLLDCVLCSDPGTEIFSSARPVPVSESDLVHLSSLDWIDASSPEGDLICHVPAKDNFGTTYAYGFGGSSEKTSFQSYWLGGRYSRVTGAAVMNYDVRTWIHDNMIAQIYGDNQLL